MKYLRIPLIIIFLAVIAIVLFISLTDDYKNDFSKTKIPTGWETKKVGNISVALPENMFRAPEISTGSDEISFIEHVYIPKLQHHPLIDVMEITPPKYFQCIMKIFHPMNSTTLNNLFTSYQEKFTEDRSAAGTQVFWNDKTDLSPLLKDYIKNPIVFVNENYVLYKEGLLKNQENPNHQVFIHQHYIWMEGGQFFLVIAIYPQVYQAENRPLIQSVVESLRTK